MKDKPAWQVWLLRSLFGASLPLVAAGFALTARYWDEETFSHRMPLLFVALVPPMCVVTHVGRNLLMFPFDFSALGWRRRAKFPCERARMVVTSLLHGKVGPVFTATPKMTWYVFPTGLGIAILGHGKVFIPFSMIVEVTGNAFLGCRLIHSSEEVARRIVLPNAIARANMNELAKRQ